MYNVYIMTWSHFYNYTIIPSKYYHYYTYIIASNQQENGYNQMTFKNVLRLPARHCNGTGGVEKEDAV